MRQKLPSITLRHLGAAGVLLSAALATAAPAIAQDTPSHGGSITINVHRDPASLDPLATSSFATHYRLGPALNRLIEWKTGPDVGYGEFVPEPGLAESWEVSDDGLTITLDLQDGVVWHDLPPVNGRAFTSADVVATFEAIKAEGSQKGLLEPVATIEAPDDDTVVLTLDAPFAPIIHNLAHQNMWILPAEAFDGSYDRATTVIGTGPFVMTSSEPGVATEYERNPNYFKTAANGDQLPYLDAVTITPIQDLNARINAFRSGQLDVWFGPLNLTQLELMTRALPDLQIIKTVANTQSEMFLNTAYEPFSDLRVRQAVNEAIDRVNMGRVVRGGGEVGGVVGAALAGQSLPDAERLEQYGTPDVEKARELLAEAGYPDGFDAEFLVVNFGEEFVREAEWVQQDLAEIGINATIKIADRSSGLALADEGNFQMLYLIMSPFSEAQDYFYNHFDPDGPRNYSNIDDPKLNEMIAAQGVEIDDAKRLEMIHEIQRYVFENVLDPLPMWSSELLHPVQAGVMGYYPSMTQGFPMLDEMYIAK